MKRKLFSKNDNQVYKVLLEMKAKNISRINNRVMIHKTSESQNSSVLKTSSAVLKYSLMNCRWWVCQQRIGSVWKTKPLTFMLVLVWVQQGFSTKHRFVFTCSNVAFVSHMMKVRPKMPSYLANIELYWMICQTKAGVWARNVCEGVKWDH